MDKESTNKAKPHTIKKFELMSQYAIDWAYKILNLPNFEGIVFIDCMCNSGQYLDNFGQAVDGTPVRVARSLEKIAKDYPQKNVLLFFNDFDAAKIQQLQEKLSSENLNNVNITYSVGDANDFLTNFPLTRYAKFNKLLFYDPYKASINWAAVNPFLNCWGEVIINHMIIDTIRGVPQAQSGEKVKRYEGTYEKDIEELLKIGNDRQALNEILIGNMRKQMTPSKSEKTYITSFPFHNTRNGLVYNLVFCSHNIEGFKLFKKTAWKTFGDRSSMRTPKNLDGQISFDLNNPLNPEILMHSPDKNCHCISDIAQYVIVQYRGQEKVLLDDVWRLVDMHPIFPSDGYKQEIKKVLKETYGVKFTKNIVVFS